MRKPRKPARLDRPVKTPPPEDAPVDPVDQIHGIYIEDGRVGAFTWSARAA